MKALITEICETVYMDVKQLYQSLDSSKCPNIVPRIEETIKGINQQIKFFDSDNFKQKKLYTDVIKYLVDAKKALQSEKTDDYKESIVHALDLSHHIEKITKTPCDGKKVTDSEIVQ